MNIRTLIKEQFEVSPTDQQEQVFAEIETFLNERGREPCFVLRGYAGTGKTTIIAALIKVLPRLKLKTVLLAPTGRAAKVLSNYSGMKAFTIHKRIYRKKDSVTPEMNFSKAPNLAENTLFIVDEASMIGNDSGDFGATSLLHDLIYYVFSGKNCMLMFSGDTAQLPPVGSLDSPALDHKLLNSLYQLKIYGFEMTEVVRQAKTSGILYNATQIRNIIRRNKPAFPKLTIKGFGDIFKLSGERLEEGLQYAYNKYGEENTLVICRSNKNANNYNQQIRNRILYREEELTGGDYVMVVRNNYFWLKNEDKSANSFIANGDIARIRRVRNIHEMFGFKFADVVLEFLDYPDEEPLSCKLLLDTLYADSPSLSAADSKRFYEAILDDYKHIPDKKARTEAIKADSYYNALQIKFAFAVTCHKAQGGQWDAIFVDQGFLTEEMVNIDFLRWLYTAVTRATKELFLVNFNDRFFSKETEG